MYLDRLEIAGFKSFAQKMSFTFDRGITAIVGPNGSGKSNLADAIRWVLGEQSMKSLRGKRSEDVIFSGSEKSSRLGFAEVSLVLNNEDRGAPLDYSELTVSRKVYRSGEGEYLLNRAPSRLTDIALLLARLHLGSRTYSVIGQGMVDAILALSPFERKDFFDEAAGVKPFEMKREEALRKLEGAGSNLSLALVQLKEIEPRLKYLTRQVRRLERREEILVHLRELLMQHYGSEWRTIRKELTHYQSTLAEQVKERQRFEVEVEAVQKDMAALTKESSHADTFTALQREYQRVLEEKARMREEEVNIRMRVAVRTREHLRTAVPLSVVREAAVKLKALQNKFHGLQQHIQAAKTLDDVHAATAEWEVLCEGFETIANVFDPYLRVETHDDMSEALVHMIAAIKEADARAATLQVELRKLTDAEKQERTRIWHVQERMQELQQRLNAAVSGEHSTRIEIAKRETRKDDLKREAEEEFEKYGVRRHLDALSVEGGEEIPTELLTEIHRLKGQLELIGGIDPEIEKEYHAIFERHTFLRTHVDDLNKAINDLEVVIQELDATIEDEFTKSFHQINEGFQKYFKMLFGGGRAKLVLVKEVEENKEWKDDVGANGRSPVQEGSEEEVIDDPVKKFLDKHKRKDHIGVEIHATPPGKRLSSVNALSGGERALTSIALIASIIANNPAPFVVLDEVDAALDEANSLRFAGIIQELSARTQFVIITHNRATMEQADILYGVTMGDDGISKVLSLKLEDAVKHGNR
ncbi:MAG: AAA family ATPase [Patescibacteria group bacterium]